MAKPVREWVKSSPLLNNYIDPDHLSRSRCTHKLLFATGAGAASRVSLGTAVVFGMLINAVIGTLFVPNFWELLQRFGERHIQHIFNPDRQASASSTDSDKDNSASGGI